MKRLVSIGAAIGLAAALLPWTGARADDTPSAATIAHGHYLLHMGDCEGCHDAPGRPPLSGGQYMGMPFGKISTPNITPDRQTGIGLYTDADFIRLMRHGINQRGQHIYPAMPYPWYNTLSDADLIAIKDYLFSLKPVYAPREPNKIWFPFTLRPMIGVWDLFFVPDERFKPDPHESALVNRGRFIVGGLEHCGECHNHRNFLGNTDLAVKLQGGPITIWYAPSLRTDPKTGIGDFTEDEIAEWLKTGYQKAMGPVAGPMEDVIDVSTSKLTDEDRHAIAAYILSNKPTPAYTLTHANIDSPSMLAGRSTYLSHCASCHQENGQGIPGHIPALDGNGMVRATGPQDVLRVIYGGHWARGPLGVMPGVGADMTDAQVVSVTNYVRRAWSNQAPGSATLLLAKLVRADTHTLTDGSRPGGCPTLANATLQGVLDDKANGVAATLAATNETNYLQNIDTMIKAIRGAAPQIQQADLVNGLMVAYCPVAMADTRLAAGNRWWHLTRFAERVYTQLTTNGAY